MPYIKSLYGKTIQIYMTKKAVRQLCPAAFAM